MCALRRSWCLQKAHTQTGSNYKFIFLYMLKNIEIIKFDFLTRFECVLFDVKLHYTDVLRLCWWQTFVCRQHWSDAGGEIAFADRVVCCLKLMVTTFCCLLMGLQGAECVLLDPKMQRCNSECTLSELRARQPEGRERARALHHHTIFGGIKKKINFLIKTSRSFIIKVLYLYQDLKKWLLCLSK